MANSFNYKTAWSKVLLINHDAQSVMAPLFNRKYEGDIKEAGDTVKATLFGNVTIGTYTPGSDMSPQDVSTTDSSMTIDQMKYWDIIIDKVEQKQGHHDYVKGWQSRAMVAMAQTVDDRCLSHYADADSANVIGTTAEPVSLDKDNVYYYFRQAHERLRKQNIGDEDTWVAVVDPETITAITMSEEMKKRDTSIGDEMVTKGTFGKFAGFKVVESNRISTVSGSKNLMFFHKDFATLAMQIPEDYMEMFKPEKRFGTGIKGMALYGTKAFHPKMCAVIKKAAA